MTGLQKQAVPVQLGQGIDTKTDKKGVVPGKLLLLENAVMPKRGQLAKRFGYRKLSSQTMSGLTLTEGSSLATFKDQILQFNDHKLYSYSSGLNRWLDKGPCLSAKVRTVQILQNTYSQTNADSANNNGISVFAWTDNRTGSTSVRASVVDDATATPLLVDVSISGTGETPRCIALGQHLYVFFHLSGTLYASRVSAQQPTGFDAAVQISNTVDVSAKVEVRFDLHTDGTSIFFAHKVNGSAQVKIGKVSEDLTVTATTTISATADSCVAIVPGPGTALFIAWHSAGVGVKCAVLDTSLSTSITQFLVDAVSTDTILNITGYTATDGLGVVLVYQHRNGGADPYIKTCSVLTAGSAGTPVILVRSVGLASKAFTYTSGTSTDSYFGVAFRTSLQSTYFVLRSDGLVVAKQRYGVGEYHPIATVPYPVNVSTPSSGVFTYAVITQGKIESDNGRIFTTTGVEKTSIDFTSQDLFSSAQLGDNLLIAGGVLSMYDGQSVVEHGFHLYPEMTRGSAGSTGGSMAAGIYQFVAVYEWLDNFGRLHRSAPSVPATYDCTTLGTATNHVSFDISTLRLTQKSGNRSPVSIVLYGTEKGPGQIFYRLSSTTAPTYNDTTIDSVNINRTVADASIIGNEILTMDGSEGAELSNFAPPACTSVSVCKNRAWLAGLEQGNQVWFSKENKTGIPVEFNDELFQEVESNFGDVVAVDQIEDKVVYFKGDRYYYTYGDGPNNAGTGAFADPTFKTSEVGCASQFSLVRIPSGLMLKTAKGYYAIDGNLDPAYLGDEVEDFNGLTVTAGNILADANQVRFATSDGVTLVYDYYMKQWYTFTGHESNDAVIWQGRYAMLRTGGDVMVEDPTTNKDAGAPVRMRIGTGWLAMASVIGLQRVYKYALLGEYKSQHQIRVSLGFDFSEAYTEETIFDPDTALDVSRFGDGTTFGSDPIYGGTNIAYRFVSSITNQKCQSVRFLIEELTTGATPGTQEGFSLSVIGLLVGLKSGLGKFRAKQNLGAG